MIPEQDYFILVAYSKRDEKGNLVLNENAPKEIIELAKKYYWKPYNIVEENGILVEYTL